MRAAWQLNEAWASRFRLHFDLFLKIYRLFKYAFFCFGEFNHTGWLEKKQVVIDLVETAEWFIIEQYFPDNVHF